MGREDVLDQLAAAKVGKKFLTKKSFTENFKKVLFAE